MKKEVESNHKEKIEHLLRKYREESKEKTKVPEKLARFKNLSIYKTIEKESENQENVEENEQQVKVLGDIEIDENENDLLKLTPNYQLLEALTDEEFALELELCNTKYRWTMMKENKESDDIQTTEEEKPTEEEQKLIEKIEAESRQVFNPIEMNFDLRKKRVTDLRENSRVILPKPLPINQEALISLRREKYNTVFRDFRRETCNSRGEQRLNLTFSQRKGLQKLKKRIKNGEIVIMLTDKSGRFAATTPEIYAEMGKVHTNQDREISEEELKRLQRVQNGHVSMWFKMTNTGENWNHQDRFRESCINET